MLYASGALLKVYIAPVIHTVWYELFAKFFTHNVLERQYTTQNPCRIEKTCQLLNIKIVNRLTCKFACCSLCSALSFACVAARDLHRKPLMKNMIHATICRITPDPLDRDENCTVVVPSYKFTQNQDQDIACFISQSTNNVILTCTGRLSFINCFHRIQTAHEIMLKKAAAKLYTAPFHHRIVRFASERHDVNTKAPNAKKIARNANAAQTVARSHKLCESHREPWVNSSVLTQ